MSALMGTALLSGALASVIAVGVTRAIERFGGLIGGVLGTMPTTIIPTSIGLALRLSQDKLADSMYTVAVGMLVNAAFLSTWRFLPLRLPEHLTLHQRLAIMVVASLTVWIALAAAAVSFQLQALQSSAAPMLAFCLACYIFLLCLGVSLCLTPLDAPAGKKAVPLAQLAARGLLAGTSIFITVMLSSVDGVVAGMASTFPAIFSTTMVSLWLSQGQACPLGATGPMVLGSSSVPTYAFLYAGLVPSCGPWAGALVAWLLAVGLTSYPITRFVTWRRQASVAASHGTGRGSVGGGSSEEGEVQGERGGLAQSAEAGAGIDDSAIVLSTMSPVDDKPEQGFVSSNGGGRNQTGTSEPHSNHSYE